MRVPSHQGAQRKAGLSMTGRDLRDARQRMGWTQEETAEKLGVTQAYLSMLESGRRAMPYELARLAAAEQECCSFFDFTVRLASGRTALEVRAPADAQDVVASLFGVGSRA